MWIVYVGVDVSWLGGEQQSGDEKKKKKKRRRSRREWDRRKMKIKIKRMGEKPKMSKKCTVIDLIEFKWHGIVDWTVEMMWLCREREWKKGWNSTENCFCRIPGRPWATANKMKLENEIHKTPLLSLTHTRMNSNGRTYERQGIENCVNRPNRNESERTCDDETDVERVVRNSIVSTLTHPYAPVKRTHFWFPIWFWCCLCCWTENH